MKPVTRLLAVGTALIIAAVRDEASRPDTGPFTHAIAQALEDGPEAMTVGVQVELREGVSAYAPLQTVKFTCCSVSGGAMADVPGDLQHYVDTVARLP